MTDIEFLSLKRKYFALYLYMLSIFLMLVSIRPSKKNESVRSPALQTPSYRAVTSINKDVQPEKLLQEGGPLPGPATGLLSNTRKWIVGGDTCADKARDFIGKGHPGGEQQGKGTQENCSATWLAMLGFMVMGLVSGWSLANHSNSESFLVAPTLLSQDGW